MSNRTVSPWLALLACGLPCAGALAQGFSSISSAKPAAAPTATTAPAAIVAPPSTPAPPAPAAAVPAAAPPVPVVPAVARPVPAAFSSGAGTIVPQATPVVTAPQTTPQTAPPAAATAARSNFDRADRVLVRKSERRLYLLRQNQVIAEYPVRLGLNPNGPKQREGDFRTPEGVYEVVRRNPRSEYFLSLQVSYPNDTDVRRARHTGVQPGGLIMIHGLPNVPRKPVDYYARNDWTDGCIAVSNSDMVDIWLRTGVGTTIEIRP